MCGINFLKVSRLIKRRTLAKEVCEGQVVRYGSDGPNLSSTVKNLSWYSMTIRSGSKMVTVRAESWRIQREVAAAEMYTLVERKGPSERGSRRNQYLVGSPHGILFFLF